MFMFNVCVFVCYVCSMSCIYILCAHRTFEGNLFFIYSNKDDLKNDNSNSNNDNNDDNFIA